MDSVNHVEYVFVKDLPETREDDDEDDEEVVGSYCTDVSTHDMHRVLNAMQKSATGIKPQQRSQGFGMAHLDILHGIKTGGLNPTSFQQNFLSSARVKAGWAFGDLLAYGTVGWAYSTSKLTDTSGSSNKSIKGTAYGAGAEFAVTRNAFLRVEYLRYDFGDQTYVTPLNSRTLSTTTNLLRAGASVHF